MQRIKGGKVGGSNGDGSCGAKAGTNAIQRLLASRPYQDEQQIFLSQRGEKVLKAKTINRLVKQWCRAINLKGNYGSHTLRKTWSYHQRIKYNVGIPELMVCFTHSTQKQTLDYLCIQQEEIKSVYANEILLVEQIERFTNH